METTQIDMLFLELSQFTTAKTARELKLEEQLSEKEEEIEKLKTLLLKNIFNRQNLKYKQAIKEAAVCMNPITAFYRHHNWKNMPQRYLDKLTEKQLELEKLIEGE